MKAFVLTAGKGTRLRPYTETLPKPALPLLNIPIVYYSTYLLEQSGIKDFVFNLHHLPDEMKSCIKNLPMNKANISFSHEEEKILGGAGGLLHAWDGNFETSDSLIYVNGDEIFFPENPKIIFELNKKRIETGALATILVKDHPGLGSQFGAVWVDSEDQVMGFGKSAPEEIVAPHYTGSKLSPKHFTGYISLDPSIVDELHIDKPNLFYDTFLELLKQKDMDPGINVLDCRGQWFEVGNFDDYLKASKDICQLLNQGHDYLTNLRKSYGDLGRYSIETGEHFELFRHPDTEAHSQLSFKGFNCLSIGLNLDQVSNLEDTIMYHHKGAKPLESYKSELVLL